MIIMGDGVAFSGAQAELARVAELLGAEVWGANSSEVNIDYDAPALPGQLGHMFGAPQPADRRAGRRGADRRDLRLPRGVPGAGRRLRAGAKVIHIDLNAYEIAKNYPVDLGLVADPKLTLAALAAALEQQLTAGSARRRAAAGRRTPAPTANRPPRRSATRDRGAPMRSRSTLREFMEDLAAGCRRTRSCSTRR